MTPPVIVVGSGAAGMATALALAPLPVVLLTKTPELLSGSTPWAQGGLAAALSPQDCPRNHATDTVTAGAGLTDPEAALLLATESISCLREAIGNGLPVDRMSDGSLCLGREAAHSTNRIVHIGGDRSGHGIATWLATHVRAADHITVITSTTAVDLTNPHGMIRGICLYNDRNGWFHLPARAVVLATGGWGQLWPGTTNPVENTGDGLAVAARAGAVVADMEFMQFHPTALSVPKRSGRGFFRLPLLTEALRGAGAILVNDLGQRFVDELAPRDVVARAIDGERIQGRTVRLDLRPALFRKGENAFPQVTEICRSHGLDPFNSPVPVEPAAHYAMGGILTDAQGRTSCPGLWAVGEVACTGVHGANRLASNSLPEALVFARRAARDIQSWTDTSTLRAPEQKRIIIPELPDPDALETLRIQAGQSLGINRSAKNLEQMQEYLEAGVSKTWTGASPAMALETRSLLTVAQLVCSAALERRESRGSHTRTDFPETDPAQANRNSRTLVSPAPLHNTDRLYATPPTPPMPEPTLS